MRGIRLSVLLTALAVPAGAAPPTIARTPAGWERLLGRPYGAWTPMPGTGASLWVSHPRDWGFSAEVNYFHLDLLSAYRLSLTWNGGPVAYGPGWAHTGHLESEALPAGDVALNTSLFGWPVANTSNGPKGFLLDGDRRPVATLWQEGPGAGGELAVSVEWAAPVRLATMQVYLIEDAPRGLALPSSLRVEWQDGPAWRPVAETSRAPALPGPGANRVSFTPVTTSHLRVVFAASSTIAMAELEAYPEGAPPLELVEHKIVRSDDVLLSILEATNRGDVPARLEIEAASDRVANSAGELVGSTVLHSIPVSLRLAMLGGTVAGDVVRRDVVLAPGASFRTTIAMPFARSAAEAEALATAAIATPGAELLADAAMTGWLHDHLPQLDAPDPAFEKMFAFRGALMRRTLGDPRYGPIQHPAFQEGRWVLPWYAQVITFGAPHQLRETRWLRDSSLARGHALNFVENQRADGAFVGLQTSGAVGNEYIEWLGAAIAEVFLVTGDTDLLARSRSALTRNLDRALGRDGDGDLLPLVSDHFMTGMEWQPAFFHFSGYDATRPTPLERVEYATALAATAGAAARAAEILCDDDERARLESLALAVAAAMRERMWDPATRFYYPLREGDDAPALVREIAGFYPFAFGLAPPECEVALAALFDVADFATPYGPASSSLACPATSQDGWPIGPGGSWSMWNGPTWPHATAIAIEAVARTIRRSGEGVVTREQLFSLLESYTFAQFEGRGAARDFLQPMIGENYRGDDGRWKSDERDYFHSTYLDLVIRFLVGLEPSPLPEIRIDPLLPPGRWERFLLERVRYRGHEVTVAWDAPDSVDWYGDGREGLELWVDGALAASRPDLGLLMVPLPRSILLGVKERAPAGRPVFFLEPAGDEPWSLWRSPSRELLAPVSVTGDRIHSNLAVDPASPASGVHYYRSGACGTGR